MHFGIALLENLFGFRRRAGTAFWHSRKGRLHGLNLAGYDSQAFVQFLERLHINNRHKHNFIASAFATHPMTEDRIRRAQEEISILLLGKTAYIIDTSAFQQVKSRLADLMHEHAPIRRRSSRTSPTNSGE